MLGRRLPITQPLAADLASLPRSDHRPPALLWTSGRFEPDALDKLESERKLRSKHPIDFKDGDAILALAHKGKEKSIADAFRTHFLKHPLAKVALLSTEVAATRQPHDQDQGALTWKRSRLDDFPRLPNRGTSDRTST